MNAGLLLFVVALFVVIIVSYMFKESDFLAISLLCCFLAATVTGMVMGLEINDFLSFIDFEAIIVILSMTIITKIAQDSNILEYIAVKLFRLSRGNQRAFFYLMCLIATTMAAVMSDFVVVLVLAPIVVRLCHYLKIRAGTYLLGMAICINVGGTLAPFSSGENIIIYHHFDLTLLYFVQFYWLFAFFLVFVTMFLIDKLFLSKEPKIDKMQKNFVLELIDEDDLIKNKKMFYINSVAIIVTLVLFVLLPLLYLTAAFSAFILVIINKHYTKKKMSDLLRDMHWELIFFLISLFIVVGCLNALGLGEIILAVIPFKSMPPFAAYVSILLIVSFLCGFVVATPMALIFIPVIDGLIAYEGFNAVPLLFAFYIGINLGGNLSPTGSSTDITTLKIAKESSVENLTYSRLLKIGFCFAILHLLLAIGYLFLLMLIFP